MPQITKLMCRFFFKKVNHTDCKIIAFEVKKIALFSPYKTRSANFESSWFKTFALHKVEDFNIALGN
jgi:hypothetical protein